MSNAMQSAAQEVPAAGESDASVPCCGMNGWQSQWPWLRVCTTAHSARRRPGAREVEEQDQHEALRRQKAPPPGKPPGVLKDPEPHGRDGQHSGIGHEVVQALGVPVLQMVEQPVDASALAFIKEEEAEAKDLEVECMELGPCRLPQVLSFARADEGRSAKASAPPEKVAG